MKNQDYKPLEIEEKWRKKWEEEKIYQPNLDGSTLLTTKKPFYNLMMFPYPSAEGLHVGNVYAFTGADTYGRFKRMQGNDVFEPMGLDGFGIHSENYALKIGKHPKEQAEISSKNFYRQLHSIGNGFDWSRKVETYDPSYYKWTQWIFIQLFKRGLAYRKKAPVNFCPKDLTVLSDEQVIDGKCERCSSIVEKRDLEQWFFKITDYAERLLNNIPELNWTEKVKIAQRDWIGKKEGINISFDVILEGAHSASSVRPIGSSQKDSIATLQNDTKITVFTTTPVNFAATFLVLAPEHPLVAKLLSSQFTVHSSQLDEIREYVEKTKKKTQIERQAEGREKTGVFTGAYVLNQVTNEQIPVWVSDFVLMDFGTGAVQGCPGHDMRDFEFAAKFGIPIKRVVVGPDGDTSEITKPEQVIERGAIGTMVNSEFLNGLSFKEAMKKTMDYFEEKGWGKRVTTYHLRDWLISRQRYWGPPIPMIFCEQCEWQPVPEDQLPVLLPEVEDWKPKGEGTSPLANIPEFVNTVCPQCGGKARRETDVSDTFLDSAWYFLRYLATEWKDVPFPTKVHSSQFTVHGKNDERTNELTNNSSQRLRWLPVTMYIGGAEHSVLHLLYSRFITMVFKDMGLIDFEEPFARFYAHGLIIKDGAKMSKSKGNVVNPDEYLAKYGADTLRCYLRFVGPFDMGGDFRDSGIEGMHRFLKRVWNLIADQTQIKTQKDAEKGENQRMDQHQSARFMHKTIKGVTEDLENLRFNTAVAKLMTWHNYLISNIKNQKSKITKEEIVTFVKLLAPFAPFMAEELYQEVSRVPQVAQVLQGEQKEKSTLDTRGTLDTRDTFQSVHMSSWPTYDEKYLIEDEVTIAVQVNGKLRDSFTVSAQGGSAFGGQSEVEELARNSEKVQKYLEGHTIKKVIYVPGKVINFVI